LGKEHPDWVNSLDNLADNYFSQGKYKQAEPLFKQALAIDEKTFGAHHLQVAHSLSNLGELYDSRGMKIEAESYYLRALKIKEKALKPGDPELESFLYKLAQYYN